MLVSSPLRLSKPRLRKPFGVAVHTCCGHVYTRDMALPVAEVQRALADERLDGWLALRLPGLEPDRRAAVRAGGRQEDGHAALVLPDSGDGRTARPGARDRASQSRRPARRENSPTPGATASTPGCAELLTGHEARGDGILAGQQHSRTSRASMPARSSPSATSASRWCRRAISCSGSRRCGPPKRWPPIGRRRTPSIGSRIRRSRSSGSGWRRASR